MSEIIPESEQQIVDETVSKLLEHFDSVRVFTTRHDGNSEETACYNSGGGNFYAQLGQVREWIVRQDQYVKNDASKSHE
jgi:hypothetical protein